MIHVTYPNLRHLVHLESILQENPEEMFPRYYIHSDVINKVISSTTHYCVVRCDMITTITSVEYDVTEYSFSSVIVELHKMADVKIHNTSSIRNDCI